MTAAPTSRPPAEPPRATSALRPGPARRREVPRAGDEVGERVDLVQQLAFVVPAPAHLAAAADVRDRVAEAAVQQRQPRDRERRVGRVLVAAVAVQQERRGTVARHVLPADDRERDRSPVRRGRPLPVLLVVLWPVRAATRQLEHGAAAQQREVAGRGVAVVHRVRGHQRDEAEPEQPRVVLRVRAWRHRVHRLTERHLVVRAVGRAVPAARSGRSAGSRRPGDRGKRRRPSAWCPRGAVPAESRQPGSSSVAVAISKFSAPSLCRISSRSVPSGRHLMVDAVLDALPARRHDP